MLNLSEKLVAPLLDWYDQGARILPWRSQPTPYRVWVSEIMLQQTRVEAVKPYFERFISALPDIEALANAEEEILLKLWEGLGYYNRVRNLQKAAKMVQSQGDGELPRSPEALQKLPGIGPYTAGAIASIAYGVAVPAVDGNVLRVIARLQASEESISHPAVKRRVQQQLEEIIPLERAGDFNQALMELGATVCLPNGAPDCEHCPVRRYCEGYDKGIAAFLPVKEQKKKRREEKRTVFLLLHQDQVALAKRPPEGLLAGLWEFPSCEGWMSAARAEQYWKEKGARVQSVEEIGNAKHIFSHIEWQMRGYVLRLEDPLEDYQWVNREQRQSQYALPSAFVAFSRWLDKQE